MGLRAQARARVAIVGDFIALPAFVTLSFNIFGRLMPLD